MTTANWIRKLKGTPEGRRLSERERVWSAATEHICALMDGQKVSRAELARRLGKSPAYVTKLLRGTQNFTLGTLSDIFHVLGASLQLHYSLPGTHVSGKTHYHRWPAGSLDRVSLFCPPAVVEPKITFPDSECPSSSELVA